ncbi:MAG: helix-turn-helix domain-containing protein [Methylocystis sp.]|uniref:helix-turn-helix domain-containing protein n=1 Tax=Methylocystis sp. TaxID=1911079 RepID=UPI003DA631F7
MSQDEKVFPDTVVQENYVTFQHEFIEFLVAQLIDFRKVFNGDLDELLVFIFVARYYLREERGRTQEHHDQDGYWAAPPTLSRIAEFTGIARETVRRKLISLQARGLIEKVDHDKWQPTTKGDIPVIRLDYEQFWAREMRRLVKLIRALKSYV